MNTERVIKDLENIRGNTTTVFGQKTVLPKCTEKNDFLIDTIDILKELVYYETTLEYWEDYANSVNQKNTYFNNSNDVINFLDRNNLLTESEICEYDSFCHNAPLSNHFRTNTYKLNSGEYLIELKVYKYGSITSNYTEPILLKFENLDNYYDIINNISKSSTISVNNNIYTVNFDIFNYAEIIDNNKQEIYTTNSFNNHEKLLEIIHNDFVFKEIQTIEDVVYNVPVFRDSLLVNLADIDKIIEKIENLTNKEISRFSINDIKLTKEALETLEYFTEKDISNLEALKYALITLASKMECQVCV